MAAPLFEALVEQFFRASVVAADHDLPALARATSGLPAVDSALAKIEYTQVEGLVRVLAEEEAATARVLRRVPLNNIVSHLRLGNFRRFFRSLAIPNTVRAADENAFRAVMNRRLPDFLHDDLIRIAADGKRIHPGLNVTARTGDDLYAIMSVADRAKVESMYATIARTAQRKGITVTAGGVFTGLALVAGTALIWNAVAESSESRRGCFMLRTVNGTTRACRISERSCSNVQTHHVDVCTPADLAGLKTTNPYYFLSYVLQLPLTSEYRRTVTDLLEGGGPDATVDEYLAVPGNALILVNYIRNNTVPGLDCSYEGAPQPCFMCSPTAEPSNPAFIDTYQLASNQNIVCITSTSVIESLTDVATNIGAQLFDSVSQSSGNSFSSPFFVGIILLVVVVIIASVFVRFAPAKNTTAIGTGAPPSSGGGYSVFK